MGHRHPRLIPRRHPERVALNHSTPRPERNGPRGGFRSRLLALASAWLLVAGCDLFYPALPGGVAPGKDFDSAALLPLDAQGKAVISGNITSGKVDVYSLGPLEPGDRVIVSVRPAAGSNLDPIICIFNSQQEVFALNDDLDYAAGKVESYIDEVVTVADEPYYLAVSKFYFGDRSGAYVGDVEIRKGETIPTPAQQIVMLDFDGGVISIPGDRTYTTGPFDSADIDAAYTGMTDQIKAKIVETVRQNFRNTSVVIVTTDDPAPPECTSTVFFGAFSETKFGVAQDVDAYNRDRCDDALVFTNNFDDPFNPRPSADGIGVAIGNVAAHEMGHLLGLNHVADVTALMDTTGSASTLLTDQEFKTAPLSITIFPTGKQNDMALLDRVLPPKE